MKNVFAYRLKSARIQKGLTQEALAIALKVSKQLISQYENGKKRPSSSTLIALSKYFKKSANYFLRPVITPLDNVEFRKKASLKGNKLSAVKVKIQDHLEPYLELENLLGASQNFENPISAIKIESIEDVEKASLQLLERWNLGINPIPNIVEMLEDKGIKIVDINLDLDFDGLSTLVNNSLPVIVLNAEMDTVRKRFTIMHELGHLLLNISDIADNKFKEAACNRFASSILLPAEIVYNEIGERRSKISFSELIPIKEYYGISLAAIMYRLKDLGIIPEALNTRYWKARSRNPKLKTEEGYGDYKGEEKSNRFDQLLSKAISEELISLSKAATLSGKSLSELRQNYKPI